MSQLEYPIFCEDIWTACASGNLNNLNEVLNKFPRENGKIDLLRLADKNYKNPLFYAAESGNIACVKLLLEQSNIQIQHLGGEYNHLTVLHTAILSEQSLEMIDLLVSFDNNLVNVTNELMPITPLHCADIKVADKFRKFDYVSLLLENQARDHRFERQYHNFKMEFLCEALHDGNLELLIYILFCSSRRIRPADYETKDYDMILNSVAICSSEYRRKVACYKIIFNFLYSEHQHRPYYSALKVFPVAVKSACSNTSLLPFFIENTYLHKSNKNHKFIKKFRKNFGPKFDLILLMVHSDLPLNFDSEVVENFYDYENFKELISHIMKSGEDKDFDLLEKFLDSTSYYLKYLNMLITDELARFVVPFNPDRLIVNEPLMYRFARVIAVFVQKGCVLQVNDVMRYLTKKFKNSIFSRRCVLALMPFTTPMLFENLNNLSFRLENTCDSIISNIRRGRRMEELEYNRLRRIVESDIFADSRRTRRVENEELHRLHHICRAISFTSDMIPRLLESVPECVPLPLKQHVHMIAIQSTLQSICRDTIRFAIAQNAYTSDYNGRFRDCSRDYQRFHELLEELELPRQIMNYLKFIE